MKKETFFGFGVTTALLASVALVVVPGCDETIDATPAPDGGAASADATSPTNDAATPGDAGNTCKPGEITGFTPTWKEPVGLHLGKCSPTQIATLATCVWPNPQRNEATCNAFFADTNNAACIACGRTPTTEPKLGAVVSNGASVQVNYPGCIAAVTNDVTATGCGAKVQAKELCLDFACVNACPTPAGDNAAFQALLKCQDDAAKTVCKTYADAAACADPFLQPGGAATVCAPTVTDFGDRVEHYLDLFCGSTGDAGTDGG